MDRLLVGVLALSLAACGTLFDTDSVQYEGRDSGNGDTGDTGTDMTPGDTAPADADAAGDAADTRDAVDAPPGDVDGDTDDADGTPDDCEGAVADCVAKLGLGSVSTHTCAINAEGRLYCFGNNFDGQLGDPARVVTQPVPTAVVGPISDAQVVELAAGINHTCARTSDGGVWCWGGNSEGQLGPNGDGGTSTPIQAGSGSVGLAVGWFHTCSASGGAVQCWGLNDRGQLGAGADVIYSTPQPVSMTLNAVEIDAGGRFTCVVDDEARVACWGDNADSQLGVSPDTTECGGTQPCRAESMLVTDAVQAAGLSAGAGHACYVQANTHSYCWGDNEFGQLGDGRIGDQLLPAINDDVANLGTVAAGGAHSCAAAADGQSVRCWGDNELGQLGTGNNLPQDGPVVALGVSDVGGVAVGDGHSCVWHDAGGVSCWGGNDAGQLGVSADDFRLRPAPTRVAGLDATIVEVASGEAHNCARDADGQVWCWGNNGQGQLGDGVPLRRLTPLAVTPQKRWSAVATGATHTCAVDDAQALWCWGRNDDGQLGVDTFDGGHTSVPTQILTGVERVAAGDGTTCAVTADQAVMCWGRNDCGNLGIGTTDPTPSPATVRDVLAGSIAMGEDHSCLVDDGGRARCWGRNGAGQLGVAPETTTLPGCGEPASSTPVEVVGVEGARQVGVGAAHSCAVLEDGAVLCWGGAGFGQLGIGAVTPGNDGEATADPTVVTLPPADQLALGELHSCALTRDGDVYCWGYDGAGQIGTGLTDVGCDGGCQLTPVRVPALANVVAIAAGRSHTCAVTQSGELLCWGGGDAGQLGDGDGEDSASPSAVTLNQ